MKKKLKLKRSVKISIFIISIILEVLLYAFVGKELSLEQIILYSLLIFNTCFLSLLGYIISEEMGYK